MTRSSSTSVLPVFFLERHRDGHARSWESRRWLPWGSHDPPSLGAGSGSASQRDVGWWSRCPHVHTSSSWGHTSDTLAPAGRWMVMAHPALACHHRMCVGPPVWGGGTWCRHMRAKLSCPTSWGECHAYVWTTVCVCVVLLEGPYPLPLHVLFPTAFSSDMT